MLFEDYVVCLRCGHTLENDKGGITWEGEVINWEFKNLGPSEIETESAPVEFPRGSPIPPQYDIPYLPRLNSPLEFNPSTMVPTYGAGRASGAGRVKIADT